LASWQEDKVHGAFIDYAMQSSLLTDAAAKYREAQASPERADVAGKKLAALALCAENMLRASRSPPKKGLPWQINLVGALLCAGILWGIYQMFASGLGLHDP
jgi:hypothetical protein